MRRPKKAEVEKYELDDDDDEFEEEAEEEKPLSRSGYKSTTGRKEVLDEDEEDSDEEDSGEDDSDESEDESEKPKVADSMFIMGNSDPDKTRLPEGIALAKISDIEASIAEGQFGEYTKITVTLDVTNRETKDTVKMRFIASKTSGRLRSFIAGVTGDEPDGYFDLRSLLNQKTKVVIEHRTNERGEIWDEIAETRYFQSKNR